LEREVREVRELRRANALVKAAAAFFAAEPDRPANLLRWEDQGTVVTID
jgi:hypothetical protein